LDCKVAVVLFLVYNDMIGVQHVVNSYRPRNTIKSIIRLYDYAIDHSIHSFFGAL